MTTPSPWRPWPRPDQLREMLDYDPKTGTLTWKPRKGAPRYAIWNAKYPGKPAGCLTPDGLALKIDNRSFAAHRVIWAMVHNRWPECISHRNGDKTDNRLENLRAETRLTRQRRQRMHKSNTSGRTGVSWSRKAKCWIAQIKILNRSLYLGSFDRFEDAVAARARAEKEHGFEFRG